MGYAVYEDPAAPWRWAGYGVPAVCDWKTCDIAIDRGMSYRCDDHGGFKLLLNGEEISYDLYGSEEAEDAEEEWVESEGCYLHFCSGHLSETDKHDEEHTVVKPDTPEWEAHILSDESWAKWRDENPEQTQEMKERQNA